MTGRSQSLDVLVIGAGQAGLALGYYLRQTPLRVQLVDRHARVGDAWRHRFDSSAPLRRQLAPRSTPELNLIVAGSWSTPMCQSRPA
jgi:cation diffusion facilitator CzcD-associated flavoprotein CzcO